MGYFRILTDSSFKVGSDGKTIFYPWGIIGKGYVLPNKQIEENIRKALTGFYIFELALIIIIGAFLGLWIVLVVLTPAIFFIWYLQYRRFIQGLEKSSEKLTLKGNISKLFSNKSR